MPDHAFFEQAVLQGEVGQRLLQVAALLTQRLHFVTGRRTGGVPCEPLLASFEEFLRPAIIQAFGDPLTAADRGDAVFATQAFQDGPDFVLGRMMLARRAADVFDCLLDRRCLRPGIRRENDSPDRFLFRLIVSSSLPLNELR